MIPMLQSLLVAVCVIDCLIIEPIRGIDFLHLV